MSSVDMKSRNIRMANYTDGKPRQASDRLPRYTLS